MNARVIDPEPAAETQSLHRFEWRVMNWGRYVRDRRRYSRCASAEGAYEAPYPDEASMARFANEPIDHADAGLLEQAFCRLREDTARSVLKARYVYAWRPHRIMRMMGIKQIELFDAKRLAALDALRLEVTEIEIRQAELKREVGKKTFKLTLALGKSR